MGETLFAFLVQAIFFALGWVAGRLDEKCRVGEAMRSSVTKR